MKNGKKWILTASVFLVLAFGSVFCVQASYLPEPKAKETDSGVMYMTGGVGVESRTAMNQAEDNYNLKVVVASTTGAYLADALVTIKDAAGKTIFQAMTDGPWLLVKLPKGTYRVKAAIEDRQETRGVSVSKRLKTIFFHWKP